MARLPLKFPFDGDRCRELRELAGLSIGELAERCAQQGHRVHHSAIGKVERDVNKPSPALLMALATALDVTPEDFRKKTSEAAA
jgi:transcriptional regulator with XRE-family HTH domain